MLRRLLAVTAALAAAFSGVAEARAGTYTSAEVAITMTDGVPIAATFFTPDGTAPVNGWPAVVMMHGLGASRTAPYAGLSMNALAGRYLAAEGYAVLTVDARGHGSSGGVSSLVGPREIEDVRALVDWLDLNSSVDGTRIGAFGVSLGAGTVWRAAAEGVRFRTIVPVIGWTDLYDALFPQDLSKSGLVASLYGLLPAERWSPLIQVLRNDAIGSTNVPALRELARERSVEALLDRVRIPVFMLQGRRDFAFDLDQALQAFGRLTGPKRLYVGDLGHSPALNPSAEVDHYLARVRTWFDRFLKGIPNGVDTSATVEIAPDPWTGSTFQSKALPKRKVISYRLKGARTIEQFGRVVRTVTLPRRPVEIFGMPLVQASVSTRTGWGHLVAVLSAVTPGRKEVVVSQGGVALPSLGRKPRRVTIRLMSNATLIPAGSRLRLTLAATSTAQDPANLLYLVTVPSGSRLAIGRVNLSLPTLVRPISR